MAYFLAKTDPETYSVENFAQEGRTTWDGVRNPQALQAIRAMRPGDEVLIYHSQGQARCGFGQRFAASAIPIWR